MMTPDGPLDMGRFEPVNAGQRERALAGIAAVEADWARLDARPDGDRMRGTDPHWRAAYRAHLPPGPGPADAPEAAGVR
jgi:hypothetical protein